VNEDRLRRELLAEAAPEEQAAGERAWPVVEAAFAAREPVVRPFRHTRPLLALAFVAALVAAALTPPGRAIAEEVREAFVGVEEARPQLFSLRGGGRLLVESDAGPWVVSADGSKRLLGAYREASWSPFARFVVAARGNELAALERDGTVRWKLARPDVRFPRWGGSATDTRIAYLSGGRLHIVAGDGTGDVDAGGLPTAARVAPAWRPGPRHVLAYATTRGRVYVYDDAGSVLWRSAPFPRPRLLTWSRDGQRLALVTADKVVVFAGRSGRPLAVRFLRGVTDAAFAPGSHDLALVRAREVLVLDTDGPRARPQRVFAGAGVFDGVAWSPDRRWILVGWREADQWVFVRVAGKRRIEAVSRVSDQFESASFPRIAGWCCAPPR
jgi:hypothetical protein